MNATPTRQSPSRLSSPSKIHATPSRTRHTSPRKSPAKNRIFQGISSKPVSFTPEKTKQPPRAWERRPATPFIPRDDKQKIWKRVPLGEIGIEPNRPVNISRREQEAAKDYVRVVKKMKVGHAADDEDKENASVETETSVDGKDLKRRVRFDSRSVSMKMEEDVMADSPKKKLRTPLHERDLPNEEESLDEDGADNNEDEAGDVQHSIRQENREHMNHHGAPSTVDVTAADAYPNTDIAGDTARKAATNTYSSNENATPDASHRDVLTTDAHGPDDTSTGIPLEKKSFVENADACPTHFEATMASCPSREEQGSCSPTMNDHELLGQSMEFDTSLVLPEQLGQETEEKAFLSPVLALDELRSSSPPTVLAENVLVDELESRNASRQEISTVDHSHLSNEQAKSDESKTAEAQESISRRISDDEAAFLRNFVFNSKAERAAREKKMQEMVDETVDQETESPEPQADTNEGSEQTTYVSETVPTLEPSMTDASANITGSPLRRSKRAVITSIPRPQILPNAIQLKRANGNEFIFTANKASSVANVAILTRSNTKRNKGSALNVMDRLVQLTDDGDEEHQEQSVQGTGEAGETSAKSINDVSREKTASKKRKREAKDGGVRVKKVLKWNDENLVSYQEAERILDGCEDIEDSSQENDDLLDRENGESDTSVKLTLTLSSNASNTHNTISSSEISTTTSKPPTDATPTPEATPSQSRVRRVRRGTSGTVNGTPGPKTRSRQITDDRSEEMDVPIDVNGSVEDSTAVTAAINTLGLMTEGGKRSRMPVPVASRVAGRRGATVTGGSAVSDRAIGRAGSGEVKKGGDMGKMAGGKEDGKGDLLGRRRLRVRP